MNRRSAFLAAIGGLLGFSTAKAIECNGCKGGFTPRKKVTQIEPTEPTEQFLVFIHMNVEALEPHKAEVFCERVGDHLRKKKPNDCLNFFVVPQRTYATWVEVFPLTGNGGPSESIDKFVYSISDEEEDEIRRQGYKRFIKEECQNRKQT